MPGRVCQVCAHPRLSDIEALLAQRLPCTQVAAKFGLSRDSVQRHLKSHSRPRIAAALQKRLEDSVQGSLAVREARIAEADELSRRMRQIVDERGADPDMADVPGGRSGLLVRTLKQLGGGDSAQVVTEYEFDAALVRELRENRVAVAKELGQFNEGGDAGEAGGMQVVIVLPGQLPAAPDRPELAGETVDIPVLDVTPRRIG